MNKLRKVFLLINIVLMIISILNSTFAWEVLPGQTSETITSVINKTGDAVLAWVRIVGIILIVLSLIIAGILYAMSMFTHNYAYAQTSKTIMIVGPLLGLFIILASPLITSVILKWFGLGGKWNNPNIDESGGYFDLP